MKSYILGLLAAVAVNGHYQFPDFITGGVISADFQYVRETTNHYSNAPVTDVTDPQLTCYELAGRPAANVSTAAAGSSIGFQSNIAVYHPGPLLVYMAQVPEGQDVNSWNATGDVWFKIYQQTPSFTSAGMTWPSDNEQIFNFTIPSETPSGNYLVRIEHIAIHTASTVGGAQFYVACGQVAVTGGGSGTPTPTVAIPGVYSATDPGILIDIYYPIPTSYVMPGPAVWS